MPIPEGVKKQIDLSKAGFSPEEIDAWKSETAQSLLDAGFTTKDIGEYFGEKDPDMSGFKKTIEENLAKAQTPVEGQKAPPREAQTFEDAIEAGYQMSVAGLIKRGEVPDVVLPEHAPMYYRIASGVSGLVGDLPAMMAGSYVGGEAGTLAGGAVGGVAGTFVFPGVGTAAGAATGATVGATVGAGAGAFALPAAIRTHLMQQYEKGDVKDFNDFWERSAATFIEASKQAAVGAATAGVGAGVAKVAAPIASAGVKTTAKLSSEVATMTTLGAAIEGHAPQPEDFIDGAILVGGLHVSAKVPSKLRTIYAKTGVKPEVLAEQAIKNPIIQQDLLAESPPGAVPESVLKENGVKVETEVSLEKPASETAQAPKEGEPGPIPERPEAVQKILSQIGEKPEGKTSTGYSFRKAYADIVDKLDPVNEAVKKLNIDPESLTADQNPYQLARTANDYKAKTKYVFEAGTLDYKTLARTGEGYKSIVDPFKKDKESFDAYLAAKRVPELEARGLKSGFDVEAAKETVALGKKQYEEASNRLVEFQNRILQYVKDSGRISEETYLAMRSANKAYVPFSRIIEPEAGGKGGKSSSLKAFKGSEKKIQSPLLSILENTNSLLKLAESNRAGLELVKLAEKMPGQTILEKVSTPTKAIEVNTKEMEAFLKEHGIDADAEALTIFRKEQKYTLADNEFSVWRNGKREIWKSDFPGLAEAIKGLNGDVPSANIAMKIARGFTVVKKFSVAITPDFIIRNVFGDQLTAGALTKGRLKPFADILPAIGDLIKKNDNYYRWLKSGGAQGTFLEINENYLQKQIFELDKKTGFLGSTWNVIKKPVDYMQAAGALAENATRLAEFKRVTKGATEGAKVFEGGFASREVTLDFSRIGAKMSAFNAIMAFQNVGIQGLDRSVRAFKADPTGTAMKAVTYITVPSILLWWANKDDERVKAIPRWQRDLYWIIPTDKWEPATEEQAASLPDYLVRKKNGQFEINNGAIFRVPKPRELGLVFGTIPERVLEKYIAEDPNAAKDFGATMEQLLVPTTVPDAVAPIREQWANKSLFTGNKIVAGPLEGVLPAYQYTEYTSESAKQLAKMIRVVPGTSEGKTPLGSPVVVENYVRAWTGNLGAYALQAADVALAKSGVTPDPVKPKDTLADIPFVKAFVVRFPSSGAQPIQDFYNEYAKHEQYSNTITHLRKTGQYDELQKLIEDPVTQDNLVKLAGINEALKNQAQFARRIYKNPDFTADEQRQMLDGVYYGMIETAKAGNDLMREIEQSQKENR